VYQAKRACNCAKGLRLTVSEVDESDCTGLAFADGGRVTVNATGHRRWVWNRISAIVTVGATDTLTVK
jgi:hypothetical protein